MLYAWWDFGAAALHRIVAEPGEDVSAVVLWPEHFDVALTLTTAHGSMNLGFSPGDGFCAQPYVYAGPWEPRAGDFWDAPFGAHRTYRQVAAEADPAAAVDAFVARARAALARDRRRDGAG